VPFLDSAASLGSVAQESYALVHVRFPGCQEIHLVKKGSRFKDLKPPNPAGSKYMIFFGKFVVFHDFPYNRPEYHIRLKFVVFHGFPRIVHGFSTDFPRSGLLLKHEVDGNLRCGPRGAIILFFE